jgi:two-component system chemotaxis response regulator CheB
MSEVKVVKRITHVAKMPPKPFPAFTTPRLENRKIQAIAIGASTGGPPVLQKILSGLPPDFPAPLLIVQHIAAGFAEGFADWLAGASRFPLHLALNGEPLLPGQAYVAPDGFHLGLGDGLRILLSDQPPENGLRPSVAHLFLSVAQVLGPAAVGVLLTGMGRDGAEELKLLRNKGAITIAQDEESSVVHGMPGEAIKLGAAAWTLPPE